MRRDRVLIWVPLVAITVCTMGITLLSVSGRCSFLPWLCDDRSMMLDRQMMALVGLFPLLVSVGLGIRAGVVQFFHTRQVLKNLLDLPRCQLPATLVPLADTLGMRCRLDVVDDTTAEAFCYGLLRPRICITTGLLATLTPTEVAAVLCHEQHHLQQRDPLRALLWTVLDRACWWAKVDGEQIRLRHELAADQAVIATGGRLALASALLKLLTHPHCTSTRLQGLAISSLTITDARIDQLLASEMSPLPPLSLAQWLGFPIAVIAAMLLCSTIMAYF